MTSKDTSIGSFLDGFTMRGLYPGLRQLLSPPHRMSRGLLPVFIAGLVGQIATLTVFAFLSMHHHDHAAYGLLATQTLCLIFSAKTYEN